jgi:hypothetical protein
MEKGRLGWKGQRDIRSAAEGHAAFARPEAVRKKLAGKGMVLM